MKRSVGCLVLGLLMMVTTAMAGEKTGQGLKIWFDVGGPVGGSYNTVVQNGAKAAAQDLGVDLTLVYSDWHPEKMIENFKKAVAVKPDGIVVMGHPGDAAYAPFIDEARKAGILVTSCDTPLPEAQGKYQAEGFGYIGPDNYSQGKAMAEESIRRFSLNKGDRVFVWGLKRLPTRGRRAVGILETLEAHGIVVDYYEISPEVDQDPSLGAPLVTGYLASRPDAKLMIIDHGSLTAQMESILRTAGQKPGAVAVAGFSLSPAMAAAIKNGYVHLVGDAQPFLLGYLSVAQIALTKKYGFSGLTIDTGSGFIHAGNLGLVEPLAKKGLR